jgi:hypothetical protein
MLMKFWPAVVLALFFASPVAADGPASSPSDQGAVPAVSTVSAVSTDDVQLPAVKGRVLDASGLALPGVTVTLTCGSAPPQIVTTDETGAYAFAASASRCSLTAALEGFAPASRDGFTVGSPDVTFDLVLQVAGVKDAVTVTGGAAESPMPGTEPAQPSTVSREVIDNAALPNSRVDDVMPLIPSVLRGPDGLISMAGARGTQSALLINGGRETDPVTGEFGVDLPLESVQSIEVFPTGYAAEFGQATGSVARVRTRRGEDRFRASVNSFDPRPRFQGGTIRGFESWTPNLGLSGPIKTGKVWFAQSLDYGRVRSPIDTLAGTQDTRLNRISSLTQIDAHLSAGHDLTGSFSASRQIIQGANLGAFAPLETRPRVQNGGWSLAITDRLTLGPSSLLESTVQVKRLGVTETSTGDEPYRIGHDLTTGNYFNEQDRTAYRTELSEQYTRTSNGKFGPSLFRMGMSVGYQTFDGTNVSRPVELLRSDGTLSRSIAFAGAGDQRGSAYDLGLYAAERWRVSQWLTLDVGARLDAAAGVSPLVSPRSEWTFVLPWDPRMTFKGGAGIFADKLVLGARAFGGLQSRIVQSYDRDGLPLGPPIVYTNEIEGDLSLPKAVLWNLEMDRDLGQGWRLRVNYQQREGKDELVVNPRLLTDTTGVLGLSSTGDSRSRSVETTIGYVNRPRGLQGYVSYVRSSAHGNLNDLNAIEGNFKEPFVQADQIGPLRFDAPHRVLAWGLVSLPWRTTVAPFVEWRSGFPYSAIDEDWNYVGARNTERFPRFFSLDVVVNKHITLPFLHVPARIGFKVYNVTGQENGRDVQTDIERADFDQTYNRIHRRFRGIFEINWGRRKAS